jgi:hypothetical protein
VDSSPTLPHRISLHDGPTRGRDCWRVDLSRGDEMIAVDSRWKALFDQRICSRSGAHWEAAGSADDEIRMYERACSIGTRMVVISTATI